MLRDITIGQHLPGTTVVHRMDPRLKILLIITFIVMLFVGSNPVGLFVAVAFLVAAYALARIPPIMVWKSIKPLLPILLITALLNLFFYPGTPLFQWWIITINREAIPYAIMMCLRIITLIVAASLLTYTTSPIVLTDAIERLLSPLARFGFPAHELAMMMTIALRMIPTLIEETDKIMSAQKARGAQLDSGGVLARVKAMVPVLIPLFISAFRRAEDLALAMECRCYRGGEGRTKLRVLHMGLSDLWAALLCVAIFVLMGFSSRLWLVLQGWLL